MKGIKYIGFDMTEEEYEFVSEYKNTHGRPTWREMMLDYVAIKTSEEGE